MERKWIAIGSVLGGLAVALGAFGAHSLRDVLTPSALETFETGVRYQFYHAVAIILAGLVLGRDPSAKLANAAGWLFMIGVAIFSGSLYLLTITGMRWLGAITPIGGVAFIVGWACLGLAAWRGKR
ncbi:MAG: DUF423 domain-containing protein [Chloroflexota bacterium]|jgi:uncharacterized membrane protein YgdD (TMEM256/DUF423 family)|nr:DUF423 domain-containing protein [Chloroflexota bacterium]